MKKNLLTLVIITFLSIGTWASEVQDKISEYQKKFDEKFSSTGLSQKEKFALLNLAGRELYNYQEFQKSLTYYKKIIELDSSENKSEAYINSIANYLALKDQVKLKTSYDEAIKYYDSHPNFSTSEIKEYLNIISMKINNKYNEKVPPFYGHFVATLKLEEEIKNSHFAEALSMINPENIARSEDSIMQSTYDLLNVLVNKTSVKNLYCSKTLKKYPNSSSYSMLICKNLEFYIKNKKLDSKKLDELKIYFSKVSTQKNYLLDALNHLDNKAIK
jgi:tetratricopeptide (TPR) repeat protein